MAARFLAAQGPGSDDLLAGLPPDADSALGSSVVPTHELIEAMAAWTALAFRILMAESFNAFEPGLKSPSTERWASAFLRLMPDRGTLRRTLELLYEGFGPPSRTAGLRWNVSDFDWTGSITFYENADAGRFLSSLPEAFEASGLNRLIGTFGVRVEPRVQPSADPRLPADARTVTWWLVWSLGGWVGHLRLSVPALWAQTYVPTNGGVISTFGLRSKELAAKGLQWLARDEWRRPDVERFSELAFFPGPRHVAGYVALARPLERLLQERLAPDPEAARIVLTLLGHPNDQLVYAARLERDRILLGCSLPLEALLRSYQASNQQP